MTADSAFSNTALWDRAGTGPVAPTAWVPLCNPDRR